ncbi:MBL fold metallo-hydrolase [Prolixibacteraceae bacterium Z1-6]|uniref:MBL fold metallo-hydrolase n=1 Tax=Draconibacterium aestuarii TaxID=2998507 RepID=A0A9X3J926_9BACT|nr:MBL fold metallo-hydrolase [Prolixibacteraceae bacterium Z1-6]
MNVTVLTDNLAGGKFLAEHGLSYLLEIDGEQILFDTGHSDVFLRNAEKLGIYIHNAIKTVVLSHGHWDHGNGLQHLENKTLLTHPGAFLERFRKIDHSPVGLSFSKNLLLQKFDIHETKTSYQITENLYYLGEIPRLNNFESQTTSFELADGTDDFILDDSALVAIQNNELIIVTGCSHSGICNICENAKAVTGISKIKAVIGGFHLKFGNRQTTQTIVYFKENKVETLLPSHCTDLPALALFYEHFKIQQVKTGMVFEF